MHDLDSNLDALNDDKGNDLYSAEDDKLNESGLAGDDEDDHDQAFVLLCDGVSCEGHVNASVDENCEVTLTPSMFLTGDIFPDHIYTIVIKDENGNIVPNELNGDDAGKVFTVSIFNPLCGNNSCWMTVLIEDKLAPTISCEDVTISCAGVGSIPTPQPGDDCQTTEAVLINEIHETIDCDPNFIGKITRTYIARDAFGNESDPCTQTIMLERIVVGSIIPPVAKLFPTDHYSCGASFPTNDQGNPTPQHSGVPTTVDGIALYPLDSSVFCNAYSSYSDEVLIDDGCTKKIMRTFIIGEWNCNSTNEEKIFQMIDISDDQAPTIVKPSDMTVSTATFSCSASVVLPEVDVSDICNTLEVDVAYPGGFLDNQNGGLVALPVGVHIVTYTAYDKCLNSSSKSMTVTVVDQSDPIAICDNFDVVNLNGNGVGSISAVAIDDGSF